MSTFYAFGLKQDSFVKGLSACSCKIILHNIFNFCLFILPSKLYLLRIFPKQFDGLLPQKKNNIYTQFFFSLLNSNLLFFLLYFCYLYRYKTEDFCVSVCLSVNLHSFSGVKFLFSHDITCPCFKQWTSSWSIYLKQRMSVCLSVWYLCTRNPSNQV